MRVYLMILAVVMLLSAGEVFGMGKSDGSKEKVESSVSAPAEEPMKTEQQVSEAKAEEKTDVVADDKVLVTVNGVDIKQSDVTELLGPQKEMMAKMGRPVTGDMEKQMEKRMLDMLVEKQIIRDKIASEGIVISDEDIKAEIEEIAKQRGVSSEEFKQSLLERSGISEADFNEQVSISLGFEKLLEKEMEGKVEKVTEEAAKAYYDENIKQFTNEEQAKASHILIDTRGKDEAGKVEAKAQAEDILKQVKDGGDFAELAKTYSSCPSKSKGGDLGYFEKGRMVPEFSQAAFALNIGEVSDIVETQFGYHIIKLTDKKEAGVLKFEDEKDKIMDMLESNQKREFAGKFVESVKSEAKVVWSEPQASAEVEVPGQM
ncbi:MAG: peptidylprolyl isomerase [Sedimentisphaerales bacterium]|nr:peptidylprolyl isomerase [Sedimentisphaerales bacterium]